MYLSLHHERSVVSHSPDKSKDIQGVLRLHPEDHAVQSDEGTSTTHTSTAVHQQRWGVEVRMMSPHSLDEVDETGLVSRHSVIWPGREVIVSHYQWNTALRIHLLQRNKT